MRYLLLVLLSAACAPVKAYTQKEDQRSLREHQIGLAKYCAIAHDPLCSKKTPAITLANAEALAPVAR